MALDDDGTLSFYATNAAIAPVKLSRLPRKNVALGAGEFTYRLSDEESRININGAAPDRVDRLLTAVGLDKQVRDVISDSLQDWKDPDDLHRVNGAESEDYYLKLPVPYRARNGVLQDEAELLQIRGVTREIYRGSEHRPALSDLVTVAGRDAVNMNTAPVPVLTALGLSQAEILEITGTRVRAPYTSVPARFAGKGLAVGTATFRIEAEGLVAGEPRARVVAIVQRRAVPGGPGGSTSSVAMLSWRPGER